MKIRLKFLCLMLLLTPLSAAAERVKDLASVLGVRENQLLGYGLVVGLDATGDQSAPHTLKSTLSMLSQLGVGLPQDTKLDIKSLAAVLITASLPAFTRPGQTLDITVSSIGNAKSLRGGTLILSPLKGADGQVYAMAQGNLLVTEAAVGGAKGASNNMIIARIPGGATVERAVPSSIGQDEYLLLTLNKADFTTASRMSDAINTEFSNTPAIAAALDSRAIRVRAPQGTARVAFMARLENLQVEPAQASARVIINAHTGSVVMNQAVRLEKCSIAHGNMTVVILAEATESLPQESTAKTETIVIGTAAPKELKSAPGTLMLLPKAASLSEVIRALNAIGATSKDLLTILQAMKAAGALHAELEVI